MNRRDDGSASLWALSMAMVLWICVAGVLLAGVAVVARHRAATAADMASLAAASVVAGSGVDAGSEVVPGSEVAAGSEVVADSNGGPNPCMAADAVALANDATVTSCQLAGQVVDVTARVQIPALRWLGGLGLDAVSARARAGPG